MKKQIITVIAIVFVVMYLTFSFIKMQLNPFMWCEKMRFCYCLTSFLISLIPVAIISDLDNDDKDMFI